MHHVGDFKILDDPTGFDVIYPITTSGEEIRIRLPRQGAFDDPRKELSREKVKEVAARLRDALNRNLI